MNLLELVERDCTYCKIRKEMFVWGGLIGNDFVKYFSSEYSVFSDFWLPLRGIRSFFYVLGKRLFLEFLKRQFSEQDRMSASEVESHSILAL
ncbi:hypothetical protein T02_15921 [Trichinella nativa]|uniref:Uncharacterized protein n=1 Tax=Trichinella nativa TaxID=6335 RepID=A0A0V1KVX4_9BILA|nr:hypothetical protein T02_15921 [Trichinella nativa]